MYIKPVLLLSLNYSDIPGGVVVSTTDCEAIDHKFKTHLGHDFYLFFIFFSCYVLSFHFNSFHFVTGKSVKFIYPEKAQILRNLHLTFVLCSASQK